MKSNLLNLSICLVVLIVAGAGCKSFTESKAAAEKAVEKFHAQLNAEKYDEIFDQSSGEFKDSVKKEDAVKLFSAVRNKLGVAGKSAEGGWHVNTTPTGAMVRISYQTEFTNETATETFTFLLNGDVAELAGYHINSMKVVAE